MLSYTPSSFHGDYTNIGDLRLRASVGAVSPKIQKVKSCTGSSFVLDRPFFGVLLSITWVAGRPVSDVFVPTTWVGDRLVSDIFVPTAWVGDRLISDVSVPTTRVGGCLV